MSHASNEVLRDRSFMMSAVRAFFSERDVLEVDCPLLSHHAPIDAYIDLFSVNLDHAQLGYLHSSPEYGMKRLLAQGSGPIYQLSHVYRHGEAGKKHNPEFSLIEWYRPAFTFEEFMAEIVALIALFLKPLPYKIISYSDAFKKFLEIDPQKSPLSLLKKKLSEMGIEDKSEDREELLNLLWGLGVEPHFGSDHLTVITHFPPSQAMLAQTKVVEGEEVAERFEISYCQMELGNGYHELRDAKEQKRRLIEANQKRESLGKGSLPLDPHFLRALERGFPDTYGIALGFDRLMMLRHNVSDIGAILPIPWDQA